MSFFKDLFATRPFVPPVSSSPSSPGRPVLYLYLYLLILLRCTTTTTLTIARIFRAIPPWLQRRALRPNAHRRELYHKQGAAARKRCRERERERYYSLAGGSKKARNERRAKLERDRYNRLSKEELAIRNAKRRERAKQRKQADLDPSISSNPHPDNMPQIPPHPNNQ